MSDDACGQEWFDEDDVEDIVKKIMRYVGKLEQDYRKGALGGEEDCSSQLAMAIKIAVDGHLLRLKPEHSPNISGYGGSSQNGTELVLNSDLVAEPRYQVLGTVEGRTMTSKGRTPEETAFGADILLVFNVESEHYNNRKGLLIQAKDNKMRVFHRYGKADLLDQVGKMRAVTDESYVMIYAQDGFRIIPGEAVAREDAARRKDAIDMKKFFRDFFICKSGDRNIIAIEKENFYTAASDIASIRAKRTVVIDAQEPE